MARQHMKLISLRIARKRIHEKQFKDPYVTAAVSLTLSVFALNELTSDCQQCFASGYF